MELDMAIKLAMLFIGIISACFGIVKWREAQVHARITQVKADLEKDIDEIKRDYAKSAEIDHRVMAMQSILTDIKEDQHRMATRMDEFIKWIMSLQQGGINKG